MRSITLVLALALCVAPTLAQASVRLHMPHKHHRGRGAEPATAGTPTSDIPDPVFISGSTHR